MPDSDPTPPAPRVRSCATMDHHFALARSSATYKDNRRRLESFTANARLRPRTTVIRIPVVVHVLHSNDAENIGMDQIESQIAVLNADFRAKNADLGLVPEPFRALVDDPKLEFALARRDPAGLPTDGVTRTRVRPGPYLGTTEQLDPAIKSAGSGHAAWPSSDYLNLWVCNLGDSLLGYAQFPGGPPATDGVVIDFGAFGTMGTAKAPFDRGRTTTHEVGHWLNLLHIWGDDRGACWGSDNVADTPNQAGSNQGTPTFPRVTCNNGPHGDMFMNYMDYVDDAAMFMFTRGQIERMDATLAGARAGLASSRGLQDPEVLRLELPPFFVERVRPEGVLPTERVFDGVSWVAPEVLGRPDPMALPSLAGRWIRTEDMESAMEFRREGSDGIRRRAAAVLEVDERGNARLLAPGGDDGLRVEATFRRVDDERGLLERAVDGRTELVRAQTLADGSLRIAPVA